ncbi:MAG: antitermination protein NusG [Planctomycetia bacterium]|nr:antitermination protein NusG [Planctomycetia bacterium]
MSIRTKQLDLYPETLLDEADETEIVEGASARFWWAIYTKSRQEKALARNLLAYQIPFYLPLVEKTTYYGNRPILSRLPIFSNYVFMHASQDERVVSLTTNRVSRTLRVSDPDALRRDLIHLHHLIASGAPLTVESRWMPGQRVRIKRGPLAGLEGTILDRRGQTRLLVSVDFLQQGASVAVDDFLLEPISHGARKGPGAIEV